MQYKNNFHSFNFLLFISCLCLTGCFDNSLPQPREDDSDSTVLESSFSILETWPANGTNGVPPSLPWLAMKAFLNTQAPLDLEKISVQILNADSAREIPFDIHSISCSDIGWSETPSISNEAQQPVCLQLAFQRELESSTEYQVLVNDSLFQSTQGEVAPPIHMFSFQTSPTNPLAPSQLVSPTCAIDELVLDRACLLVDDQNAILRIKAQGPIRAWLTAPALPSALSAVSPQGEVSFLVSPMPANHSSSMQLRFVDIALFEQSLQIPFQTTPLLPKIFITEVFVDPHGSDKNQEYVEVFNAGEEAISLQGFYLSDSPIKEGDLIEEDVLIPSQSFALIVGSGFNLDTWDEINGELLPGTRLIHLPDTTVGSGGLNNAGEPLFLRDGNLQRISSVPSIASPQSGVCLKRTSHNGRTGQPQDFTYDLEHGCSPGAR